MFVKQVEACVCVWERGGWGEWEGSVPSAEGRRRMSCICSLDATGKASMEGVERDMKDVVEDICTF